MVSSPKSPNLMPAKFSRYMVMHRRRAGRPNPPSFYQPTARSARLAGPKISWQFPCLYIYMCVRTYQAGTRAGTRELLASAGLVPRE